MDDNAEESWLIMLENNESWVIMLKNNKSWMINVMIMLEIK